MPNFLEDKLAQTAAKRGLSGKDASAYVYGTLNNLGMMHGNKVTPKGEAAQRKHDKKLAAGKRSSYRRK